MKSTRQKRFQIPLGILLAAIVVLLFLSGCMNNYGRFAISKDVGKAIQVGEIVPDYHYFYSGRDTMPYAIIGIDKSYTVPSRFWIAFEPTPTQLEKMAGNIYRKIQSDPYGYYLMGPDGNKIGIWFSNSYGRSVKVDNVKRTVDIYFRQPESYDNR